MDFEILKMMKDLPAVLMESCVFMDIFSSVFTEWKFKNFPSEDLVFIFCLRNKENEEQWTEKDEQSNVLKSVETERRLRRARHLLNNYNN